MGRVIIYLNNSLMKGVAMLRCLCFFDRVGKPARNKLLERVIIHLNSSLMDSVAICLFVLLRPPLFI